MCGVRLVFHRAGGGVSARGTWSVSRRWSSVARPEGRKSRPESRGAPKYSILIRSSAAKRAGNRVHGRSLSSSAILLWEVEMGRSILLLILGVPLPIIILLALFWH
jgi:hypothetical protein